MVEIFHGLLALVLALARVFPCLILVPAFSFNLVKGVLRTSIVVALSLYITPAIKVRIDQSQPDMLMLAGLMMKELIIGMLLGGVIAMPFWLYESVGGLFDNQRGALMGGQINPQLGPDATPLGKMMQQTIILILIVSVGLSTITQLIWDSYELWPATQWMPFASETGFHTYLHLVGNTFSDIVLYAGPLVAIMMIIDFGIGIMSIFSPQLQATVLAIPLKCLLGMIFFILYLPFLTHLANERLYELKDLIHILPSLLTTKGS